MSFSLSVSQVAGLQISKYANIAGAAILVYDYAVTLEDEVRWVWGRSWDFTRFVFTTSRYLPFIGTGITAYSVLRPSSRPCAPGLEERIIHILGILAAEVLLVLRTYAFWQGNKRVLRGLIVYGCVTIAVAVILNVVPIRLLPEGHIPPSCLVASRNSTFGYLSLLVFEIVVLLLTAYKHFHSYREMKTRIVRTIYLDNMFYVLCIILITFANALVDGAFPSQVSDILDLPQVALHSVLASRIMFNLRRSCDLQSRKTDFVTISDIVYDTSSRLTVNGSESSELEPRDPMRASALM